MNRKQKRRFFTLLETLIALFLFSMLLTFFFGLSQQLNHLHQGMLEKENDDLKSRILESRFRFLFDHLVNENDSKRLFFFYAEGAQSGFSKFPSLVFSFDNGVRRDPLQSGDLLARLYVDLEGRLILTTWPFDFVRTGEGEYREVLAEDIEGLNYSFYSPPPRKGAATDIQPPQKNDPSLPDRNTWYENVWKPEYRMMPAMMKIRIQQKKGIKRKKEEPLEWLFVLPSSKNPVQYPSR